MKKLKVCAYTRVSTDSTDQANSFENQKSYFEREVTSRGHELIEIYADKGITGTKLDREGFNKMLYDAGIDITETIPKDINKRKTKKQYKEFEVSDREPLFNEIWVKNTSRLARNTSIKEVIDKLLQKKVSVYFIEQRINTNEMSSDLALKIFQMIDEVDSKDKSSKVKWGIEEGIKQNKIHASSKLYGYTYNVEENSLKAIAEESKVIRIIYKLYAEGKGFRRIESYLRDNKLYTRKGKPFGKSTIRRILTNEKYIGLNNRGKYDTGKVFSKLSYPKVKEKYELQKNNRIEPIVSEELFYKCKEILESSVNHVNNKGKYNGISKYNNLIYCGQCGSVFHSNRNTDKRKKNQESITFYNCSKRKKFGKNSCDMLYVKEVEIDSLIEDLINGGYREEMELNKDSHIFELRALQFHLMDSINVDYTMKVQELEQELEEVNEIIKDCTIRILTKKDIRDKKIIEELIEEHEQKRDKLDIEIARFRKSNDEIIADIVEIEKSIEYLNNIDLEKNFTHEEMKEEIEKIVIKKDYEDSNNTIMEISYKGISNNNDIINKYDVELVIPECPEYSEEEFNEYLTRLQAILNKGNVSQGNVT